MNDTRITALAQDIYLARHNETNDATGDDLTSFLDQTIAWVNQLIPEVEKKADWNFLRTNDTSIGIISANTGISYALPNTIRRLVYSPYRDLTIRQDGTPVSHFILVNPSQVYDPTLASQEDRATVLNRKIIFSRTLTAIETGGTITADAIAYFPQLSHDDVSLLDILDDNPDMRQVFVYGVVKNQILPDIVQGGLTPAFSQKFDAYLADCVADNNLSSAANYQDREDMGFVQGVF